MHLPKAELHTHLEGTISPSLALKLAKRNHITLPSQRIDEAHTTYLYQDFLDFLHTYDVVAEVIKQPQDYYDITFNYLAENAQKGAIYIEMMYSPDHAEKMSGIPSIEHLHAIQQAINDAETTHDIVGRIIITAVRHFGVEAAMKVAKEATKHRLPCVVGFGLGGDEINYPPEWFQAPYELAHKEGLACTVHAGEFNTAASMQMAIKTLPIQRIGHGIQAIHCPDTLAMLRDQAITLELCPSSNVCLKLIEHVKHHPIDAFIRAGISVCINSDDPPFFSTNLAQEYALVQKTFGYSNEEMLQFTRNAINASFADEATKAKLRKKLS